MAKNILTRALATSLRRVFFGNSRGSRLKVAHLPILILALCASQSSRALGQEPAVASDPPPSHKYMWVPGLEVNSTQELALPQHFLYCLSCERGRHGNVGSYAMLDLSPGTSGGSISIGGVLFGGMLLSNISGKLTYLNAWDTFGQVEAKSSYIGPELSVNLLMFYVKLGVLWKVSGEDSNDYGISIGAGLGL